MTYFSPISTACTVIVLQDLQVVTGSTECRFQDVKVDRRHLRAEDRVVFSHFFGKYNTVEVGSDDLTCQILFSADTDGSDQGTDTDTGSS